MKLKRIMAMVLCLCMVLSTMSFNVFAEESLTESVTETTNVAKIGDVEYATLAAAFEKAQDGDTITLLGDVTLPGSESNGAFEIAADRKLTLALAGYDITASARTGYENRTQYAFDNYADLTITGEGIITSRGIQNYGTLTIGEGVKVVACDTNGGACVWTYAESETIINGGTFTAAENAGCINSAGKLTINGGTFTQTQETDLFCYAIKFSGTEAVINDATVNGAHGCVYVAGGTVAVKDGSFTCTGVDAQTDHVLFVESGTLAVEGGSFEGDHKNGGVCVWGTSENTTVTGGTYSDESATDLLSDGYELNDNGEVVESATDDEESVVDDSEYIKQIKADLLAGNDVTLDRDIVLDDISLVEALNAVSNGNGTYCGFDYGNGAFFNVIGDYDITFDLNGHSITYDIHDDAWCNKRVVSIFYVTDKANLTITDSVGTGAVTVNGMATAAYSVALDTKVIIEGGTWTWNPCGTCKATNVFLYASHGGELYVEGGKFVNNVEGDAGKYMFFSHYSSTETTDNGAGIDYDSTKIGISGGTFEGCNPNEVTYMDQGNSNAESTDTAVADGFAFDEETGTVVDAIIEIYDWDDLKELDAIVEGGNMLEGWTVKLMNDIDLAAEDENGEPVTFSPIGANKAYFKGTFDGQGHTIKNMYQSGWALGYEWGSYGTIGLFAYVWDATVKNLTIENAECLVEGGSVAAIAGSAWGDCTFENITVKNSTFATYNSRAAGIVGYTGGNGTFTFKNIVVDEDTVIAGLWGSFDSSLGGVMGQLKSDSKAVFDNVTVKCRLDCYNDVTASYKYGAYRMCGMLIGNIAVDENNKPILDNVTLTDVEAEFGNWSNYTYVRNGTDNENWKRVEAGYAYDGVDLSTYTDPNFDSIQFKSLFGGQQYGSYGQAEHEDVEVIYAYDAKIGETNYWTLAEAISAATAEDSVVLLKNVDLGTEVITIAKDKEVTLDLAGYTITGTDKTEKNYGLFQNNGKLTIGDSVGTGAIKANATINSNWNRYSAVISNNPGATLVVNGGTIEHLGGTDMAYGIDSLTNGNIGAVDVTINGGTVKSTYRAIRQFLNSDSTQNTLTINGGSIEGENKAIFFHDPSKKANLGKITIGENASVTGGVYLFVTEGSTEWPVEVSIATAGVDEVTSKNVPVGYVVVEENGVYGVDKITPDTYTVEAIATKTEVRYNNDNTADSFTVKYVVTGGNVIGAMAQFEYDTELFTCKEDENATGVIRMNSYSLTTDANGETLLKELHFTVKKDVEVDTTYTFAPKYVQVVSDYDAAGSGAQDGFVENIISEEVTIIAQYDVTLDNDGALAGNNYVDCNTNYSATINDFDENKTYTITYTMGDGEEQTITVTKDNDVDGGFVIENVTGDIVFTGVASELNLELILLPDVVSGHTLVLVKDGVSAGYKYGDVEMYAVERYVGLTEIVENADRSDFVSEGDADILGATSVRAILIKGGVTLDEARAAITVSDKASDSIEKSFDVNRNGKFYFNDAMTAYGCYGTQYDIALKLAYYLASDVNTDFMIDTGDYDDTVEAFWATLD